MIKSAFISALAAAALAAGPALAQDTPDSFSGPYVGVQLGWQQDVQTLRTTTGTVQTSDSLKSDGFNYGGQLGYDLRLAPKVVAGGEFAVTGRTGSDDLGGGTRLGIGRTFNVTARLGYLLSPADLLYVRGGYSNTLFDIRDGGVRISETRDGYTVGAGVEHQLTRRVSARLEYNYSNYGRDDLPFLADALGTDRASINYRRHAVTAGINYRF